MAACVVSGAIAQQQPSGPPAQQPGAGQPDPYQAQERDAQREALGFLGYLDAGRYPESYAYTSSLLRAKLVQSAFAQQLLKDRGPLGAKQSRKLLSANYTEKLEGAPAGKYVVLQYSSDFANKKNAVETLVMSFENGYWRVAGWFVK
jgi:hypothetical protein